MNCLFSFIGLFNLDSSNRTEFILAEAAEQKLIPPGWKKCFHQHMVTRNLPDPDCDVHYFHYTWTAIPLLFSDENVIELKLKSRMI